MGKILGIDYGEKRTGLAQTDDDKIIAVPLETVETKKIFKYLNENFKKNSVESFVIGEPKTLDDKPASISNKINLFCERLFKIYKKPIYRIDERFTSKIAFQSVLSMKLKKTKREDKKLIDKLSATLILQSHLDRIKINKK
tara:strand:+ start:4847 stop:5269 length:423 start_codon:yes stop_codon:yes gene_type:complete